ncbi:MAG: cytochrome c [Bacteroidota bacterium]
MKLLLRSLTVVLFSILIGCGGGDEKKEDKKIKIGNNQKTEATKPISSTSGTTTIDLSNKGVGPIKNLDLPEAIDESMANSGQELFKIKCMACHKPTKKFIGPAPLGILERRSPEWIMNMILDPEGMVKNDPIAKQLLIDYNGSPMANQSLTEAEARDILEYFRTIKEEN